MHADGGGRDGSVPVTRCARTLLVGSPMRSGLRPNRCEPTATSATRTAEGVAGRLPAREAGEHAHEGGGDSQRRDEACVRDGTGSRGNQSR